VNQVVGWLVALCFKVNTEICKWHIVWPHSASGSDTLSDHTQLLEVTHCLTALSFSVYTKIHLH